MKDYNSDSTVVLDRFARDKRKRTTTAERIERRPGPRRDADDTPREHAPRRASYNPHFTEDNRPVDERPRRPSGLTALQSRCHCSATGLTGAVRTGPVRIVRAATAASVPRRRIVRVPTGRNPSVRRNTATSPPTGANPPASSGSSAPTASRRGISVTANVRVRRNVTVRSPRADSSATIAAARCGPRAIPAIIPTCRRAKSA